MDELVSIVVPIYNVKKYLDRCLASIQKQSYRNIEVIMVDDGSTDSSAKIAKKFELEDERFHLYAKENGGLSSARNHGFRFASGAYISFIDSDDFISSDYVQKLKDAFYQQTDIVISDYAIFSDAEQKAYFHAGALKDKTVKSFEDRVELITDLLKPGSTVMPVWKNMYRTAFLRACNLSFVSERLVYSEDQLFNLEAYSKAAEIRIIPDILFFHLIVEKSLSQGYRKNMLEMMKELDTRINSFIKSEYGKESGAIYKNRRADSVASVMLALSKCNMSEAHRNIARVLDDPFAKDAYHEKSIRPSNLRYRVIYSVGKFKNAALVLVCTKAMLICQPLYRRFQKRKEYKQT